MDNHMDIDEKPRPPSGSYGSHPASRLSSADAPPSHNHYSYASPANVHPGPPPPMNPPNQPPPGPSWVPPPSPYHPYQNDRSHPDAPQHPVSAPAAYGSAQRVYPGPASEHPYQPRPGSISGNSRSPIENPHQSHPAHMNGHEGPHTNHQMPPERHGYPTEAPGGGPTHGLPYPPAPEPMSAHPTAPLGPHAYPPPGSGYATPSYESYYSGMVPGGPQKRKPVRASQACDTCRNRKAKCDEGRPCSHCKENNLDCQYRELPVPKQDRHVREQLDKLDLVIKKQDELQELFMRNREIIERNERKTDSHQAQLQAINRKIGIESPAAVSSSPRAVNFKPEHNIKAETAQSPHASGSSSFGQMQMQAPPPAPASAPVNPHLSASQSADLTIPIQHTTYAHKLLLWPSIAELLSDFRLRIDGMQGDQLTEHYVDRLELSRGLPRLFGRGQGEDKNDPGKGPSSPADSSSSRSDDQESTSSFDSLTWGFSLSYPSPVTDGPDHPGGQKSDGQLNLDAIVIDDLYDSYIKHIHILHPFLNRKVLAGMIAKFKRRYSPDRLPTYSEHRFGSMSRKRKLEDENSSPPEASSSRPQMSERRSSTSQPPPNTLERSTSNIIILLVLALGKICRRTDKLPGPVPVDSPTSPSSHPTQTSPSSHPSSSSHFSNASPSSHAHTHISSDYQVMNISTPTPAPDGSTASSAPTPQSGEKRQKRNLDVIPGFAYYAVAAGMLGEHNCENRIAEAQACLLAGLYAGQLACVAASHKWISSAGSILQILLKYGILENDLPPNAKSEVRNHAEALRLCFWTCLQLESDILAEIDLPPSGISRHEDYMSSQSWRRPSRYVEEDELAGKTNSEIRPEQSSVDDGGLMIFYSTQMHLRRVLNSVHRLLYSGADKNIGDITRDVENVGSGLLDWRSIFTTQRFGWDDHDMQADDINIARVRAKFYGGSYIIHRPILNRLLHQKSNHPVLLKAPTAESPASFASPSSHDASPGAAKLVSRRSVDAHDSSEISADLKERLRRHCKTCIESAICSTEVFDRLIKQRLIITNIYGTAHAQFGNVLVLAVTSQSEDPYLSNLIKWDRLDKLLSRTIDFLRQYDEISPTLKVDADILQFVQEKISRESSPQNRYQRY